MVLNGCKFILSLALGVLYACSVMAAPSPPVGPVECHPRGGNSRIKWYDPELAMEGYLGISPSGQIGLDLSIVTAASMPFYLCYSKYIATAPQHGYYTGQIRTLGKCLTVRKDRGMHLDPCPLEDSSEQTKVTFSLQEKTKELTSAAGFFKIADRQGLKLYIAS